MSGRKDTVGMEDLAAYLDGELPPYRRAVVERHLRNCPQDAARVAAWRRGDAALRFALAEPANGTQGRDFTPLIRDARRSGRRLALGWVQAAAILVAVAGGAGAWWLRDQQNTYSELANAAAASYLAGTAVLVTPGDAADRDRLMDDISTHLGVRVAAPDLTRFGFNLAGGQLLAGSDHPAAQLIYVDARGRRVSCFLKRVDFDGESYWEYSEAGGVPGVHRLGEKLGWVVLGDLSATELRQIADATYKDASAETKR